MADQQTTTEQDATAETGLGSAARPASRRSAWHADDPFAERPEAFVGAAFAAGSRSP